MSVIGSMVFCTACGELLEDATGDEKVVLTCDACGSENKNIAPKPVVSQSKPSAFPSALRLQRSAVQTLTAKDIDATAVINETCPECGRLEVRYHTKQTRGADEGTTVFYACKCGHKWTQNN